MSNRPIIQLSRPSVDVMHALINAVHADHDTDSREIEVIVNALDGLDISTLDGNQIDKVSLLYWLEDNYTQVAAQYSGSKRDIELVILMTRMARREDLTSISKVILDICRADDVYHPNEKKFLELISSYWV